jgi:hypothetical protein
MPKVKSARMLQGIAGNVDGMIYYVNKRTGLTLARKMFKFKNHPGQPAFRTAQKKIYAIHPSQAYQMNLRDYLALYNGLEANEQKQLTTWSNVYNKLMFAMQKAMPEKVDLKTITRAQIESQNLPCRTLKAAIDAGLLPKVKGYERLTNQI